ncbi:ester cyclase [Glycomyces sp. L485]|uniref:ester cyclase n=1 Tax=Glycomyces sp. L485 TaxID=2909235 RepID=UPI001F4AF355|nr:ester cyclase [Glycomyces sp. L485]MCH7231063.1 ester cyclase [Glycomyces sp. L485]
MGRARDLMDKLTDTAIEGHDIDAAVDLYDDNAVLSTPDAGEIKGRRQISQYWHQFIDGFPDSHYEPISKIESDNKAVDEGYFIGTHTGPIKMPSGETIKATGKKVKLRSCDVATVSDGKITEHHLYFDEAEFMNQLGLTR